ncbi:MAG: polysaccharide deacetylase family protein, partial [Coriobacteriales bacterium]
GQSYQVDAGSSVQSIVDSGIVETNPGDLLAVDGSVLEEGKGEPFSFKVNGKEYDVDAPLHNGDIVELTPGRDVTEDADSTEKTSEYKVSVSGSGPMSVLMRKGVDGVKVTLVGKISGKTVTETKTKTTHALVKKFSSDTEEKVVALTFDDGPGDYTQEILDILAKYKVKATFFVDGASVEKNPDEAKAIVDGGNQIAVHAYENAYLTDMDSDEVKDSVDKTISAIKSSTGVQTDVMRAPYLAFGADEWKATDGAITYLIGATIDTHDLDGVGADQILSAATDVGPGDIIEMHAGGGDLTATVESLPKIIESLQKQGYTLVTVDELLSKSTVPTVTSSSI